MDVKATIVTDAKVVPVVVDEVATVLPAVTGKALIASKSVYGPAVTALVTLAVTRYGLGWDDTTCGLISGFLILAVSAGLRAITHQPITGIVTPAPVVAAITPAAK